MPAAPTDRKNTAPIVFRTSPAEKSSMQQLARARDVSVSTVAREAVRKHLAGSNFGDSEGVLADAVAERIDTVFRQSVGEMVNELESISRRITAIERHL